MLLDPSGITTADLGILVDGGGGFTLWILVTTRFCWLASCWALDADDDDDMFSEVLDLAMFDESALVGFGWLTI